MISTLFFINNGVICLWLYFLLIIINVSRLDEYLKYRNSFLYINFSYIWGNFVSFFFNKKIFGGISNPIDKYKYIKIAKFMMLLLFIFNLFLDFRFKFFTCLILFFIEGFWTNSFQEVSYGFANILSFYEIKLLNIGMGLSNFLNSITNTIFDIIDKENTIYYLMLLCILLFIFSFNISNIYLKRNEDVFNNKLKNENIDIKWFNKTVIKNSWDIIFGMFIDNCFTIMIFPNIIFYLNFKNKNIIFYIFLIYSIFDLLSKFFNEKLLIKNIKIFHSIVFFRVLLVMVLFYIFTQFNEINQIQTYIVILILVIFVILNGLIINSNFYIGSNLFKKDNEKYLISKLLIFAICFGNSYASVINIWIYN